MNWTPHWSFMYYQGSTISHLGSIFVDWSSWIDHSGSIIADRPSRIGHRESIIFEPRSFWTNQRGSVSCHLYGMVIQTTAFHTCAKCLPSTWDCYATPNGFTSIMSRELQFFENETEIHCIPSWSLTWANVDAGHPSDAVVLMNGPIHIDRSTFAIIDPRWSIHDDWPKMIDQRRSLEAQGLQKLWIRRSNSKSPVFGKASISNFLGWIFSGTSPKLALPFLSQYRAHVQHLHQPNKQTLPTTTCNALQVEQQLANHYRQQK